MIEQNVQVVRCEDESIWVRMGSQAGCPACESGKGCGAGVFSKLLQARPAIVQLHRTDINIRVGQMLTLAFPEQVYLKMVLMYYGWPLLVALGGALTGYGIGTKLQFDALLLDAATLVGGLLFGALAMRVLKQRGAADTILNAVRVAKYYPSVTPAMCSNKVNAPVAD